MDKKTSDVVITQKAQEEALDALARAQAVLELLKYRLADTDVEVDIINICNSIDRELFHVCHQITPVS